MSKVVTPEQVEERLYEAFIFFGADSEALNRDATLESLDVDSLDLVELAQILQEEFGIKVEAREFEGVVTVGDAFDIVLRHVP